MNKKLFISITAIFMAFTVTSSTLADPLQDKLQKQIQDQQNQLNQNKKALTNTQSQRQQLEISVQKMDNQIERLLIQIDDTKKSINKTEVDINESQKAIDVSQQGIDDEQSVFDQRMRAMYIKGNDGYLSVLLQSDGLSDFISKVQVLKKMAEYDNKLIGDLKSKKSEIEKKKTAQDTQKAKLLSLKADNEQKMTKLQDTKNQQSKLVTSLRAQEKMYSAKADENTALIKAAKKQISDMIAAAAAASSKSGGKSVAIYSSNAIVVYAASFQGVPYIWGANGPKSFDCSGFVRYVFNHFGISFDSKNVIRRTTYDMINVGTYVSRDQLQPGDVIYFGTTRDPHHVGIYVGNGCFIHAPQSNDVVKISSLDGTDYLTARRMQ